MACGTTQPNGKGSCGCSVPADYGRESDRWPEPITFSGVQVKGGTGFELQTPNLPEGWGGWGLVLSSDTDESELKLSRRFDGKEGGGLTSDVSTLYVSGKFTKVGISATAVNVQWVPQADGLVSGILYPLTGEQLSTWSRRGWTREKVEVAAGATETSEAPQSARGWRLQIAPADVWDVSVDFRSSGNWVNEAKYKNLTTGTAPWQYAGGIVPSQGPARLSLSHNNAGSVTAYVLWEIAL